MDQLITNKIYSGPYLSGVHWLCCERDCRTWKPQRLEGAKYVVYTLVKMIYPNLLWILPETTQDIRQRKNICKYVQIIIRTLLYMISHQTNSILTSIFKGVMTWKSYYAKCLPCDVKYDAIMKVISISPPYISLVYF